MFGTRSKQTARDFDNIQPITDPEREGAFVTLKRSLHARSMVARSASQFASSLPILDARTGQSMHSDFVALQRMR